ncbi:MAG: nucleoside kinase [bacterium]
MSEHDTIRLRFSTGEVLECSPRTALKDILPSSTAPNGLPYIAALVNNDTTSLSYPVEMNSDIKLLTMTDPQGWHVYHRSLAFLLAKAVKELYPAAGFSVDYAVGDGLFCDFETKAGERNQGITREQVDAIREHVRMLIARKLPIERIKISFEDVSHRLTEAHQKDKLNLLRFRNPPRVVIHVCEGFYDLAQGVLVPDTGALHLFELIHYPPGFILQLPEPGNGTQIAPFRELPHLSSIFRERKNWIRTMGVGTVGRLNEIIVNGDINDFIKVCEALHEKNVARIADEIYRRRETVRLIVVAGPSSSGKTTFAKRLAIQLRVNCFRVFTISLDNYFHEHTQTPLDENGNPDFEHVNALDLKLFNHHMKQLAKGEEIELPEFNFETKMREFKGTKLKLGKDDLLIIEGIHGLNPLLTEMVPETAKFRIYVSALTQLSLDANNRISTTDNRLIRRMVRDHKYRSHSALKTLRMWASVRKGEKQWIFPFQENADATFNSALDYELAVLKPVAEPLLMEVKPFDPEYAEARRLTAFLTNFIGISDREVPHTSMLREYIGSSSFKY